MDPDDAEREIMINEFFKRHRILARMLKYKVIE